MSLRGKATQLAISTALASVGCTLGATSFATPNSLNAAASSNPCSAISKATLAALFKTSISSKPYISQLGAGNNRCEYGIGPSSHKTGTALAFAKETFVVETISVDAQQQYAANTKHITYVKVTPLRGVGTKAVFTYNTMFPEAPAIFAIKGNVFCNVDLNLGNTSEVGLPRNTGASPRVLPSQQAGLARREGKLCSDIFSHM